MQCGMLEWSVDPHVLNCRSFTYAAKGEDLSDSDYKWQNNLK